MSVQVKIGSFEFSELIPSEEGDIPYQPFDDRATWPFSVIRFGLPKGRSYAPGATPIHRTIRILVGRGSFYFDGMPRIYTPGSAFEVLPKMLFGFTRVDEDTVFITRWLAQTPKRSIFSLDNRPRLG